MAERTERIVIAGGSVGGLALALALGRAGHRVTIVERDVVPIAGDAEAAFLSERTGAPQAHQTHGLLARLRLVLRDRFPDVLDALLEAGAYTLPFTSTLGPPQPGDDDLVVLIARRTTLEWTLRRAALAEPGVEIVQGTSVAGLITDGEVDGVPLVTGARLDNGDVIDGTVVACTGRRGDVPAWLGAVGVDVAEQVHPTNFVYLTRWYRLGSADQATVDADARIAGDLDYVKYMAVPGDGATLSATMALRVADSQLRSLLIDPDNFDRACALLPGPDRYVTADGVTPIGGVRPMGGLINRLRTFTSNGVPVVAGFHALGDAHTCTNPLYGRGCALALVQATLLADAFAAHPHDAVARAVEYEAGSAREVEPWFHQAVQMDAMRPRAEAKPDPSTPQGALLTVMAAGMTDPVIGRAIMRVFNLLSAPTALMTDPAFVARVSEVLADPASAELPEPNPGPTRDELIAALEPEEMSA